MDESLQVPGAGDRSFYIEGEREGVIVASPAIALYVSAFDKFVGNVAAGFMIAFMVVGLILSMNTATMYGSLSQAYGSAPDDFRFVSDPRLDVVSADADIDGVPSTEVISPLLDAPSEPSVTRPTQA